jgi:hypothetical protein
VFCLLTADGVWSKHVNSQEFRDLLLDELGVEFAQISRIKKFTRNTDVIGTHAEASVRAFVLRAANPMRVSTGAVIHETVCDQEERSRDPADARKGWKVPQIDSILWSPCMSPAILEHGDFALVPKGNVHGILEVKRSAYAAGQTAIQERMLQAADLVDPARMTRDGKEVFPALGIICLKEQEQTLTAEFKQLVASGKAAVLCEEQSDGDIVVNGAGMTTLVNFINNMRALSLRVAARWNINPPALTPPPESVGRGASPAPRSPNSNQPPASGTSNLGIR